VTDEPMTEVAADGTSSRGPRRFLLLNSGGWLLFGVAMVIGSVDVMPWHVILATQPAYVLIGFLLSLLLGFVYDRLGVGPASFGRALVITLAASYVAGLLWILVFYY
jgi:hypothetical protein